VYLLSNVIIKKNVLFGADNNYPGKMKTGMIFTIEPVLAQGSHEIVILEDGWTAVTLDNGRTAQCEHTVLITDDGAEILTNNVA
jgi:methionyl aminopeptidase